MNSLIDKSGEDTHSEDRQNDGFVRRASDHPGEASQRDNEHEVGRRVQRRLNPAPRERRATCSDPESDEPMGDRVGESPAETADHDAHFSFAGQEVGHEQVQADHVHNVRTAFQEFLEEI